MTASTKAMQLPEARDVYSSYESVMATARQSFQGTMQGRLLLAEGLGYPVAAATLAASIAGAASLVLDDDGERIKAAMRLGICEFAVTRLDEGLRILKNELRKKQPVAVSVAGDTGTIIREMQERGVQPDVLVFVQTSEEAFKARGSLTLNPVSSSFPVELEWSAARGVAASGQLAQMESLVTECLDDRDGERHHWLQRSPRYLGRAWTSRRYLRCSEEEFACLTKRLEQVRALGDSLAGLAFRRL